MRYVRALDRRSGSADRLAASLLLGGITAFQVALAAGAPWGRLAWSGSHEGALPPQLRAASGLAAVLWGAATIAVAAELPRSPRSRRVLLRGVSGVCAAGAALNLASPSVPERALWAPTSAAVAVLTWRAARALIVTGASSTADPKTARGEVEAGLLERRHDRVT